MGKRSLPDAVKSLFTEDNPFRRKSSPEPSPAAEETRPEEASPKKPKSEKEPDKQNLNRSSSPKGKKE
jgi:hypothetical protein